MYNDFIDTLIETANSLQMILSSTIDESSLTRHFNPFLEVGNLQNALTFYSKSVSNPKRKKQTNKQINKQRICQNSKINCLIKKIPANLHVGFSEFWSKEKAALYNKSSCPFRHFLYLDAANSKKSHSSSCCHCWSSHPHDRPMVCLAPFEETEQEQRRWPKSYRRTIHTTNMSCKTYSFHVIRNQDCRPWIRNQ